jgi:hypothetical protein
MAHKIYVSTNDDAQCRPYLAAVQRALFSLNESVITSIESKNHDSAKAVIQGSDLFLGLYGTDYGEIPKGETASYTELEYQFAMSANIPMIIFVMQGARDTADERQKAFLEHIMHQHIANPFSDESDLEAKVKLSVSTFSHTKNLRRLIPPAPSFRDIDLPSLPEIRKGDGEVVTEEEFAEYINKGLELAEGEIERIIRRALELHSASQQQEQAKIIEDYDNKITVSPIWGEPLRRSQFDSDIFMIMPFREQYDAIYKKVIQPVVAELNLTIKRGDDFSSTQGSIINEVWAALNACRLVIVETTEMNANVYYELGIAHTLGKAAVLLTQTRDVQELPFDLRHLRFVVYENTIEGSSKLEQNLKNTIIWLLNDLEEGQQS